uniref:Uncharacterized protein n=1 Tax=Anguilla anguilla TaxID=7936 RepID=A0A0E9P9S3_ANGAN
MCDVLVKFRIASLKLPTVGSNQFYIIT